MNHSQIEPLEARIAPATLSISSPQVSEGNSGNTTLTFTVTLSEATPGGVTVGFATSDGTAVASGPFPDYIAQAGTLTFSATDLTKTISVQVLGDQFQEGNETLQVNLSNPTNATIAAGTGTGTILNDGDTQIGFSLGDQQVVEGNADSTLTFTPTFSGPVGSAFSLTLSTQNGSAAAGPDFIAKTQTFAFTATQTSASFQVTLKGDQAFETAEHFFVNVTGLPAGVTFANKNFVNPAAQVSARVSIFDDDLLASPRKVMWTDVDGDIVTLTTSKGSFLTAFGTLNSNLFDFDAKGTIGGQKLMTLNVNSSQFAGANISITAEKQAGVPGTPDGRVDVGSIQAASFITSELQVIGIDLGTVLVDGDLAQIRAGDPYSTAAIKKLDVYSLGANPTTLADLAAKTSGTTPFQFAQSDVLGPISNLSVKTDVAGFVHVIGAEFGNIGTLTVGGALKGGADENSGRITVSGKISKSTIGSIVGGAGANSGVLSGTNQTNGVLGTVTVLGDVLGGSGDSSGVVFSSLNLAGVTIKGDLKGSTGSGSGGVIAGGTISKLSIDGSLIGGSPAATTVAEGTLVRSGFIQAGRLPLASIGVDIIAGDNLGQGNLDSGAVRADVIGTLTVGRDVTGSVNTPAIIGALGDANNLAIKSVKIGRNVKLAEILAGYSPAADAANSRGSALNGDASIGTVDIGGSVEGVDIVAGGVPGTDGRFGVTTGTTSDDKSIAAVFGTTRNEVTAISTIASVILRGPIVANTLSFGIVAQSIASIKIGPNLTPLATLHIGASNDLPIELGTGTKFFAIELAQP